MADIDLKTETPDATLPSTGFLFGADSQAAASPSVYTRTSVTTTIVGNLSSSDSIAWNSDLLLTRKGAANLRLGAADAAGSSIAISSVDTSAETLTLASAHGLTSGAAVQFITTGSLPGGIVVNTTYYARVINTTTIEIYTTFANATAASGTTGRVDLTSAGSSSSCQRSAPFQQLSVQGFTGTNIPGQPLIINGSQGTGTGRGGDIIFQVAPAGTTGSTQNAFLDAMRIDGAGLILIGAVATPSYISAVPGNANALRIGRGTTVRFIVDNANDSVYLSGSCRFGWSSNTTDAAGGGIDLSLVRDGANTLGLRNDTNAQEFRVYGSRASSTNFQRLSIKTLREVSTTLSGATYVSTIAIPAYAVLIGVTTRVNTAITGATTYDVGDGTDVDLWGAAIPVALNSESRTANFTAVAATGAAATSRTVTLTANGSNFTGGVVEICLHYLTTEAD